MFDAHFFFVMKWQGFSKMNHWKRRCGNATAWFLDNCALLFGSHIKLARLQLAMGFISNKFTYLTCNKLTYLTYLVKSKKMVFTLLKMDG